MRCPKCGYISFDHLETCLKCKKDIKATSEGLVGSVYNVTAPTFLKVTAGPPEEGFDEAEELAEMEQVDEMEFEDPDLEILVSEEEGEEELESDIRLAPEEGFGGGEEEFEITMEEDEEEGEIAIDMSQFTDDTEEEFSGFDEIPDEEETEEEPFSLGVPEELSDISDLEPPPPPKKAVAAENDFDFGDFDLDMDLGEEEAAAPAAKEEAPGQLSLDDLELSDEAEPPPVAKKPAPGKIDMDDELDFDLDLGGLSIHKE